MKCHRCNDTGFDAKRDARKGEDACPKCARLAEMSYQHVKKMQQITKEGA